MNDDEVAIRHDYPGLVFQRRRHALDEVEEALAAGSDVRAVLDVCGRPVALGRDVVSLVEQGIEGLKYECLIPLLFRLTHRFDPPSTGMLVPVIHRTPSAATNAITSATSDCCPMRFSACMARVGQRPDSVLVKLDMSVSMGPGVVGLRPWR